MESQQSGKDTYPPDWKLANCAPEISKICYKLCREHQNCMPEISVARYKLSRLAYPSSSIFQSLVFLSKEVH